MKYIPTGIAIPKASAKDRPPRKLNAPDMKHIANKTTEGAMRDKPRSQKNHPPLYPNVHSQPKKLKSRHAMKMTER
jgi:hypothetical protein